MGSLSNLYISQSYQSLIHLATDNTASATLIPLQDGLGNSIGVAVNTRGDLFLSGSLTASLQEGYLYVGDGNGKTRAFSTSSLVVSVNTGSLVTTSSFNSYTQSVNTQLSNLNLYTASNDTKWNNLSSQSGSWITESETASFAYINRDNNWSANQTFTNITAVSASFTYVQTTYETASVIYSSGSNQFGDELSDIQTLSGSVKVQGSLTVNGTAVLTSSVDLTPLNNFTSSQNTKNSTLESVTASLQQFTSSANSRLSSLESATSSYAISASVAAVDAAQQSQINALIAATGSYLTASASLTSLNDFTASQYVSNSYFATTGSNSFNGNQTMTGSLIVNYNPVGNPQLVVDSNSGEVTLRKTTGANPLFIYSNQGIQIIPSADGVIIDTNNTLINASSGINNQLQSTTINGTFTASLQEGYVWVGNGAGISTTVATSSFSGGGGGASLTSLNAFTASQYISNSFFATTGSNTFIGDEIISGNVNITGSLTASGLIYPLADNGALSFIQSDGAGNLSLQYVKTIYQNIRNRETSSILLGTPLYVSGATGDNADVYIAQAGNPSRYPATLIAGDATLAASATGKGIVSGEIKGPDTSLYSPGTIIYLGALGGWTATRPTGSTTQVQILGVVTKQGNNGEGLVMNQLGTELPNIQEGYFWVGNASATPIAISTGSFVNENETGSLVTTASFNAYTASNETKWTTLANVTASLNSYTASNDTKWNNLQTTTASFSTSVAVLSSLTGSYATTGSNNFIGTETISDAAGNSLTIAPYSGSYVFVQKGFASGSANLNHITASNGVSSTPFGGNLIIKRDNNQNSIIISGSSNIITNPGANTSGFVRMLGNENLILSNTGVPQVSGSMIASGVNTFNIFRNTTAGGAVIVRGASTGSFTMSGNLYGGTINLGTTATTDMKQAGVGISLSQNVIQGSLTGTAWKTPLSASVQASTNFIGGAVTLTMDSSSIQMSGMTVQGILGVNSSYYPSTLNTSAATSVQVGASFGNNNLIYSSGSNATFTTARQVSAGLIAGNNNTLSVNQNGDTSHMVAVSILGSSLAVTGSSTFYTATAGASHGSTFVGRFNAQNGNRAKSAETIFAVGTGTSTSATKTGFLIDSGSNTFVEGSLSVSGSTAFTGSAPSILSGSFSGSLITNLTDTYTDVAAIQQIVSLSSGSYAGLVSGSLTNSNTLYIIV